MKRKSILLVIISLFLVLFTVACSSGGVSSTTTTQPLPSTSVHTHSLVHHDRVFPTFEADGNMEYWECSSCGEKFLDEAATIKATNIVYNKIQTVDDILPILDFPDQTISYDGLKHSIVYNGIRLTGVKMTCTPSTKYSAVGEYTYTLTVTYGGQTKTKTATLKIEKGKPKYLGETEYTVYLNDPATQPSFEFDMENVEVIDAPYYTEVGTYKYTLKTKETATRSAIDPVEITYNVVESKTGMVFRSATKVTDGNTLVGIYLEPEKDGVTLDTNKYSVVYENNEAKVQGIYYAKAKIVDKATQEEVETYRAILTVDYPTNAEFDEYVNETFIDYIDGDQISINLLTVDYESLGLEHGDSSWYKFNGFDDYTQEAYEEDLQTIAAERRVVDAYKEAKLSYAQQISLRRIDEQVKAYESLLANFEYEYIAINYVDEYGGYVADFPTYVESYSLRNKEDIEDYINLIESTREAFPTYYDYIVAKRDKNHGFSEYTLTKFLSYVDTVISQFDSEEGYYLSWVTIDKLDAAKVALSLTDQEYNNYKTRLEAAVSDNLYNALKTLSESVTTFIAENDYYNADGFNTSYFGSSTLGQKLYYAQLQNRLGTYNVNAKLYVSELDAYVKKYHDIFFSVYSELTEYASAIMDGEEDVYDYGDDVLNAFNLLYDFADYLVMDLESMPKIDITWMDPTTTKNTTTVAYYMKSPLDSFTNEYIHLNGRSLESNNYETLSSIAHEGYPGHLYAYVNTKENPNLSNLVKISTFTGHGEGWAKYVEYAFSEYLYNKNKGTEHERDFETLMLYNQSWEPFIFALYARVDYGVNYQVWKVNEISKYLKENGLNTGGAEDLYNTLNESAGQYAPYGYGQCLFIELHDKAKEVLGAAYNEKEFNQVILNQGWCSLDSLQEYVDQYLEGQKFLLGIE